MTFEKLNEAERAELAWPMPHRPQPKALRIIDAQAARIAQLEAMTDTVSRIEYDRMVAQRDQLRAEREEARSLVFGLRCAVRDALAELLAMKADPTEAWHLDEAIFGLECAEEEHPETGGHCGACEDHPDLGLLRCTVCGRTGKGGA